MKSFTSRGFREWYAGLPREVQLQSKRAWSLFRENPHHPGLHFKKVDEAEGIYSVHIGLGYRALGGLDSQTIVWFWIGPHAEYDKLI